jgi:hypothetical protein
LPSATGCKLLALVCIPAFAQRPQPAYGWSNLAECPPQAQIRVGLLKGGDMRGSLEKVSADSLVVKTTKGELTLMRTNITRVQLKKPGRRLRHTLIGLAVGAGGGLIVVAALHDAKACSGWFCPGPDIEHDVKLGATPVGAAIGVAIGAVWPSRGWTEVYRAP